MRATFLINWYVPGIPKAIIRFLWTFRWVGRNFFSRCQSYHIFLFFPLLIGPRRPTDLHNISQHIRKPTVQTTQHNTSQRITTQHIKQHTTISKPWFEPGPTGRGAQTLSLCYANIPLSKVLYSAWITGCLKASLFSEALIEDSTVRKVRWNLFPIF